MTLIEIIKEFSKISYTLAPIILIGYIFYSTKVIRKYARRADEIIKRLEAVESNQKSLEVNQKLLNRYIEIINEDKENVISLD